MSFHAASRVLTGAAVTAVVLAACGTPDDPVVPPAPSSEADAGPLAVVSCVGVGDGTRCGDGNRICLKSECLDAACGDGVVTPPEECDKGEGNAPGAGCETNCRFSCAPGDAARDCSSKDPCIGKGTCDPDRHVCSVGSPLPSGTACGSNKLCRERQCVDGQCGDAITTSPEQCDQGTANGPGQGCETTCRYTCASASDCAAVPCNTVSCSAQHTCQSAPDVSKNGQACGPDLVCKSGACIAAGATCGNGIKEGGEDCDFGDQNGAGTGCEITCKFSCASAASCIEQDPCRLASSCQDVTVNGHPGKKCVRGATKAEGDSCGVGAICLGGACKSSVCGDGFRDGARGEQCDDGATGNLDGCDAKCKFEQNQRIIGMQMQFGTDSYCAANRLGSAIAAAAQGNMQTSIDTSIADGTMSLMFTFDGDTLGTSGSVKAGSVTGAPAAAAGYSGTSDLDWWYTVAASSIDGSRQPLAKLVGAYSGGNVDLTGELNFILSMGGALSVLRGSGVKLRTPIGAPSTPLSSSGSTPGHLASEHLSAALQSFASTGGTSKAPTGQLCGNISANSLANTPIPPDVLPGGASPCTEGYTAANQVLDLFVHGCHVNVYGFKVTTIKPTQPDTSDPAAPAAGAGAPYALEVSPTTFRVNQCKDKNGTVVALAACLNAAAYSSSFKFATDRVILR